MISPENLPTVVAVVFVLTLLALALNFTNYNRTNQVATAVAAFELRDNRGEQETIQALQQQLKVLEDKITAMEAAAAQPAPVATAGDE
jgi:hypothetical protein